MLDHPAGELVQGLGDLLEVLVVVTEGHLGGPEHVTIDVRDAQAALGVGDFLVAFLEDLRVDDDALETFQVVVGVGDDVPVHDDHAEAHPDLRGGEAAAVRPGEGVPEVLDEGVQFVFFREVGFGGFPAEHFGSV